MARKLAVPEIPPLPCRKLAAELRRYGWKLRIFKRKQRAFKVVGLTWIAERSFAWLGKVFEADRLLDNPSGCVPAGGVGAVDKWPAGATAKSLAPAGHLSAAAAAVVNPGRIGLRTATLTQGHHDVQRRDDPSKAFWKRALTPVCCAR